MVSRIGGGLAAIAPGSSGNRGPIVGDEAAPFLGPNRGLGTPIFGPITGPISDRLKGAKIEASRSAIRARKEGRPDCWRVGRDFPRTFRGYRADRWRLTGSSFWTIISDKHIPFSEPFSARYRSD